MKVKIIIITLLIIVTTIAIFIACDSKPTKPDYNNVFDPVNPTTSGDPFQLQVIIGNGGVTLTWTKPDIQNLTSFKIYRSEQESTGYTEINTIAASNTEYVDQTVENGHNYWYRVAAVDDNGNETGTTNISAINIKTSPVLVINSGYEYTPTKEVNLTILANTAQQMMLSNASDFSGANWETYTTSKNWTLLIGEGEKLIYMKVQYSDGTESPVVADTISPQPMESSVIINDGDLYTPYINVDLQLAAIGATEMFISNTTIEKEELLQKKNIEPQNSKRAIEEEKTTSEGLEGQSNSKNEETKNWEPFSATKNWDLLTGDGTKSVYVKFRNDFEIESELVSDIINPQSMDPFIIISYGDEYTSTVNIDLLLGADGYNLMTKYSEDSTFTGLNWLALNSPTPFQLSNGDGIKKVFAVFKNDFEIESPVLSDLIMLDTTPPIPILTVSPDSGVTNETIFQFDPIGSNDNLCPLDSLKIRFDWENDNNWDTNWQQFSIANYIYSIGGGEKNVKMQIQDGAGWTTDTTDQIFVNTRPVASFTATHDVTNDSLFHFDASASFDFEDGTNLQYRWDFYGDGNWETGWLVQDTINFVYANPGIYSPKLSVCDLNNLTTEITVSIIVFDGTVTDIDGNSYQIVKIGNQRWMAENLKVTHYQNGSAIPHVTDNGIWPNLSSGAYCNYNNDVNNVSTYGRLYNWYAVNDSRNIAPQGWHVPSDDEWKELEMYLGMSQSEVDSEGWRGTDEGGKMKEAGTAHWDSPNTGATNSSGFTALPGGHRSGSGNFIYVSSYSYWWSASDRIASFAWCRNLYSHNSQVGRYAIDKHDGFSIRCVRD